MDDDDDKALGRKKPSSDSRTPVLDNFSRDLNKLAEQGKLDPVIGREKEIVRIAQILSRRKKNNPIILGEPGCGKTAIVEGLASLIVNGSCPKNLLDKRIVTLDLTAVVAGTKYRGQFEERLKVILEELSQNPNIIIFIDEIHTLIGSGNSSGSLDGSNIFKPALARGEIQCIGATTLDEYRKSFEKDGALERRFQKVMVDPSTVAETIQILTNIRDRYEAFHKVSYSDEVIELCVKLADRYITDREFPDKAFDILDEVGARSQTEQKIPEIIEELKHKAADIKLQKMEVVKKQNYEEAAALRDKERNILVKLQNEKKKFEQESATHRVPITVEQVYDVVSNMTKIPVSKMSIDDTNALINMDKVLMSKVIGQDEAVSKIVKSIRRNRIGIKDPNRPIGSFIFLGSTGVGKTHLAKQIAKEMFGSESALIRVDMSEYQEKHTVSRLVGAPPGYVGYDEGGQLTEAIRRRPYSVVLLDEIEKAHPDVFNILLQVLDDGRLTDNKGRTANFRNTIIIMTSNLGSEVIREKFEHIETGDRDTIVASAKSEVFDMLKRSIRPEFLNRIDEVVMFEPLGRDEIHRIVELQIDMIVDRLKDNGIELTVTRDAVDWLSQLGYDPQFGARPLKRVLQKRILDELSKQILMGKLSNQGKVTVDLAGSELIFES